MYVHTSHPWEKNDSLEDEGSGEERGQGTLVAEERVGVMVEGQHLSMHTTRMRHFALEKVQSKWELQLDQVQKGMQQQGEQVAHGQ